MLPEDRVISITLEFLIQPDGDELFAYCPALEGLFSSGKTEEELKENMVNAATAYLRSLVKHGDSIPIGCLEGSTAKQPARISKTADRQQIHFTFAIARAIPLTYGSNSKTLQQMRSVRHCSRMDGA